MAATIGKRWLECKPWALGSAGADDRQRGVTGATSSTRLPVAVVTANGNTLFEAAAPTRPCLSTAMKQTSSW